jgi:exonuclease III
MNLRHQNIDIAFLQELKIPETAPIHTRYAEGYQVFASYTTVRNQGGIALVYRNEAKHWHIESQHRHGLNIISCILVSGPKCIPLIGAYLPPKTLTDLPHLLEALHRFPHDTPIVMGDLNVDFSNQTSKRVTEVSSLLASHGLTNLMDHYQQRRKHRDQTTFHKMIKGKEVKSRCDHIFSTDRRLFETVSI